MTNLKDNYYSIIAMESDIPRPKKISFKQLLSLRETRVTPIDISVIPGITIPAHLSTKKKIGEENTISIEIRKIFNRTTVDNILKAQKELIKIVKTNAQNIEALVDIAEEILQNFIIKEQNIKNYMHLLNAIHNATIVATDPMIEKPRTIGYYFTEKCRVMIFGCIDKNNIRMLAKLDLDDINQSDKYDREREKIINLIIIVCCLFDQRGTSLIRLSETPIYSVMFHILTSYRDAQNQMIELGNPYETDCSNEEEYEILTKMCTLYAEQLYVFLDKIGSQLAKNSSNKSLNMSELIDRFKSEVIPTLTEAFLKSKCESLKI